MKTKTFFMAFLLVLTLSGVAFSDDLESLAKQGYKVVEETKVVGEFKGCNAITSLTFTNGKVFVCSTYAFSFTLFMPDAYILQNENKEIKVLINGNAYSGSFIDQRK